MIPSPGAIAEMQRRALVAALSPPNVFAPSVIAVDLTTGAILYEKDIDTVRPIYSIIKLLAALTALDYTGGSQTATVTTDDVTGSPGTQMGLLAGDVVSYGDLIKGMLIASGNDASKAIGRTIGDSIYTASGGTGSQGLERFLLAMNAKAAALNLPTVVAMDVGGYTELTEASLASLSRGSARDLARLIKFTAASDTIGPWLDLSSFSATITGANARSMTVSANSDYHTRPGVVASKTGSTDQAGTADDRRARSFIWHAPNGHRVAVVTLADHIVSQRDRGNDILREQLPQDFSYLDPSGTLVPTDANLSSVKLLIGGDSGFTDESPAAHSITVNGATLVSSPRLLGAQSMSFDGNDYLSIADSADWHFGSGDFTIECFWRSTSVPGAAVSMNLLSQWNTSSQRSWRFYLWEGGGTQRVSIAVSYAGTATSAEAIVTPLDTMVYNGVTNYAAAFRNGPTLGCVINGAIATVNVGSNALFNSTAPLLVGAQLAGATPGLFFNGVIDEIRITKGLARLTAAPSIVPARKWPRAAAAPAPAPGPSTPVANAIFGAYHQTYVTSHALTDAPSEFNTLYFFHAKPNGTPVGWNYNNAGNGSFALLDDYPNSGSQIQAARAGGKKVLLTVGGAQAGYNFDTRTKSTNFVASFQDMYAAKGGFDGCDFNNFEAFIGSLPTEMVWISEQLKTLYGANFAITAPPSADVNYAPNDVLIAQALKAAGLLEYVGLQFYDWSGWNNPSTIISKCNEWIAALDGDANKVVMGFGASYDQGTTLSVTQTAWNAIKSQHPTIRGMFCWNNQSNISGGNVWGSAMKALL